MECVEGSSSVAAVIELVYFFFLKKKAQYSMLSNDNKQSIFYNIKFIEHNKIDGIHV